jgi:DNA repair protein RadC
MEYEIKGMTVQQLATSVSEPVRGTDDIVEAIFSLFPQMIEAYEENCVMLCLNDNMEVIKGHLVSMGTRTSTSAEPSTIFRKAVTTRGCAAIILAHNHPVGDCTPSQGDMDVTARMLQAGEVMGIPLIDHVVIGTKDRYCSIRGLIHSAPVQIVEALLEKILGGGK